MRCIVLVQKTLAGCAVDSLNSNFIGTDGIFTVALGNGCVKFFHHGLELGLVSPILGSEFLRLLVPLCRRFNVGHASIATSSYKIELQQLALMDYSKESLENQVFFQKNLYFFQLVIYSVFHGYNTLYLDAGGHIYAL